MNITKRMLAYEAIKLKYGGNEPNDSTLDTRDVMLMVTQILNEKVKKNFFENYKMDSDGVDGQYVSAFPSIAVTKDNDRSEYYSVLPSIYVALPNGRGVKQVSQMKNQRDIFIIRSNGNKGIYSPLAAGYLEGRIGCYPEGRKIWYDSDMQKKNVNAVLIKLVVAAPDSIGEDDFLPMDAAEANSVVKEVFALLMSRQPQDKLNNNNEQL